MRSIDPVLTDSVEIRSNKQGVPIAKVLFEEVSNNKGAFAVNDTKDNTDFYTWHIEYKGTVTGEGYSVDLE